MPLRQLLMRMPPEMADTDHLVFLQNHPKVIYADAASGALGAPAPGRRACCSGSWRPSGSRSGADGGNGARRCPGRRRRDQQHSGHHGTGLGCGCRGRRVLQGRRPDSTKWSVFKGTRTCRQRCQEPAGLVGCQWRGHGQRRLGRHHGRHVGQICPAEIRQVGDAHADQRPGPGVPPRADPVAQQQHLPQLCRDRLRRGQHQHRTDQVLPALCLRRLELPDHGGQDDRHDAMAQLCSRVDPGRHHRLHRRREDLLRHEPRAPALRGHAPDTAAGLVPRRVGHQAFTDAGRLGPRLQVGPANRQAAPRRIAARGWEVLAEDAPLQAAGLKPLEVPGRLPLRPALTRPPSRRRSPEPRAGGGARPPCRCCSGPCWPGRSCRRRRQPACGPRRGRRKSRQA